MPFRDFIGKNYIGIGEEELHLSAACWYYRAVSMQIAQKSSCEVATAAKPDSPGYHYQLRPCQLSSRVVDPSAINGTRDLKNPRTEREMPKIMLNVMPQRYTPPKNFGN